jgi:hypothetical protein
MHLCGLHICYPMKMDEFGFIKTVKDNMKLFSKRQNAGATQAMNLFEKMIFFTLWISGQLLVQVVSWVVMLHLRI